MNKKGLANSIIVVMLILFVFGVITLFAGNIASNFNTTFQSMDNESVPQPAKDQVNSFMSKMLWGNKIFAFLFIILNMGLLITSFTLPVENKTYFLVFLGFLVGITFFAMILSNMWVTFSQQAQFVSIIGTIPFIDYVLRFYPVINLVISLFCSVVFFVRSNNNDVSGLGGINNDQFF